MAETDSPSYLSNHRSAQRHRIAEVSVLSRGIGFAFEGLGDADDEMPFADGVFQKMHFRWGLYHGATLLSTTVALFDAVPHFASG